MRKEKNTELPVLPDDPGRLRLPLLLRRSWFRLNQAFRRRIARFGVTPDQFTILRWLIERPAGLTQKDLTILMASDANTIASTLARMEESALLARLPNSDDRRENLIEILPAGRDRFEQARRISLELQLEVLQTIPKRQREAFLRGLEKLADACEEAHRISLKMQ